MSGIPSDQEMQDFRAELEKVGLSEATRKLNQQVYNTNSWKAEEIKRFVTEETRKQDLELKRNSLKIAKESNKISKHANKLAYWALGISVFAVLVSVLAAFFK